ncbi:MAG: MmcQ/YjbR family DNA-binding protein [Patescibacteria group bacterium]|nr:MmcQ/YjbR family DNA-binding protein [Patescibacteria group bacterium]
MDHKTVEDYILGMPNAVLEYPFGKEVAVYKVYKDTSFLHGDAMQGGQGTLSDSYKGTMSEKSRQPNTAERPKLQQGSSFAGGSDVAMQEGGKMFALIAEGSDPLRLSLKCDPQLSVLLREKYETVMEGYHLNKKHWNTILLTGQLPWEEVQGLILHSYNLVIA